MSSVWVSLASPGLAWGAWGQVDSQGEWVPSLGQCGSLLRPGKGKLRGQEILNRKSRKRLRGMHSDWTFIIRIRGRGAVLGGGLAPAPLD